MCVCVCVGVHAGVCVWRGKEKLQYHKDRGIGKNSCWVSQTLSWWLTSAVGEKTSPSFSWAICGINFSNTCEWCNSKNVYKGLVRKRFTRTCRSPVNFIPRPAQSGLAWEWGLLGAGCFKAITWSPSESLTHPRRSLLECQTAHSACPASPVGPVCVQNSSHCSSCYQNTQSYRAGWVSYYS